MFSGTSSSGAAFAAVAAVILAAATLPTARAAIYITDNFGHDEKHCDFPFTWNGKSLFASQHNRFTCGQGHLSSLAEN